MKDIEFLNIFNYLSQSIIIARNKKLYKKCDNLIYKLLSILFKFFHDNKQIYYICLIFDQNSITFLELPKDKQLFKIIKNRFKIDGLNVSSVYIKIHK